MKDKVLFLCTHNSARSQMAEGLLRQFHGDRYDVRSAGSVKTRVDPLAIRMMSEIGIDISQQYSKSLDEFMGLRFDIIVTLCDRIRESCPVFPSQGRIVHQSFEDPATEDWTDEMALDRFRRVRDAIREWIDEYFQ